MPDPANRTRSGSLQTFAGLCPREGSADDDGLRPAPKADSAGTGLPLDESEGQLGWYVGYDGSSCPTLTRHGDTMELALDF